MKKYQPTKLLAYCMKISKINNNGTFNDKEIKDLQEKYINKATEEIKNNTELLLITNPEEIFYFKKPIEGKELGFYKEYLEEDTVKKYKNSLLKILLNPDIYTNETKELDEATIKFTYGKIKTFQNYYLKAFINYRNKKINELAIRMIRKDYNI